MKRIITLLLCCFAAAGTYAQTTSSVSIGQWRDHLSYYMTHAVCQAGNRVLVAAQSALFYYDPQTQTTEKLSKVNGLSDAGIGAVAYDSVTKSIVISYENSNIDIVQGSNVYNIPDIKNRSIEGSKSINSICFYNNKAYLSCGFGIVVLDLQRHEIYDTWYLGENSSAINVNCVYIDDTSIYAGTKEGLLYADKNSKALAASQTWSGKYIAGQNNKEIKNIVPITPRRILIDIKDSNSTMSTLIDYNGQHVDTVFASIYIRSIRNCNGIVGIVGYMGMSLYDTMMNQVYHLSDEWYPVPGVTINVLDFYVDQTDLYLAHFNRGLIHLPNYKTEWTSQRRIVYPNGPLTNEVYGLTSTPSGKIYVAPGGKTSSNVNKNVPADAYVFNNYYWYNLSYGDVTDSLRDVLNITVDPNDENHLMMSSWKDGVIEVKNDTIINVYNQSNTDSMLASSSFNYRIAGVKYDKAGNLIVANSLVNAALVYLNYHGKWGNFLTNEFILSEEVLGLALDDNNFYMLLYTSANKILLINMAGDMLWIDPNKGSLLQTAKINCITQDYDGEMWIGTEKGIKVIYSLYDAFTNTTGNTSNAECNNIVYDENGIAQYLLSFENITCIAVDGANRKWIGTERNGVYVLSANGDREIHHFTLENSPLFSNRIQCIEQNPLTGEVFIGTDRGLMSYRAESAAPEEKDRSLTVFPNPVRPEYDGLIAIKGFVEDSDVRITDANGRMVAHLQSLGGLAVWDGKNFNGQRVGTGVYFIFSSANEGNNKAVGKVLIIR
ncbi:MAG: hypothetical protein IJ250_02670 [Bacteroidales bacterium]|nr:hypothetical protein [Bacteroidales bacterium]